MTYPFKRLLCISLHRALHFDYADKRSREKISSVCERTHRAPINVAFNFRQELSETWCQWKMSPREHLRGGCCYSDMSYTCLLPRRGCPELRVSSVGFVEGLGKQPPAFCSGETRVPCSAHHSFTHLGETGSSQTPHTHTAQTSGVFLLPNYAASHGVFSSASAKCN